MHNMEVEMKKWVKNLLISFLLLAAVPALVFAAEMAGGNLTVEKNDVKVALNIPEGKTETITSLRLQMRVSLCDGGMEAPTFEFADTVKSVVRDVSVSREERDSYLVDIIISGKKDQNIFGQKEHADIGTLSLHPDSEEYQVKVEIIDEMSEGEEPIVKYVDSSGFTALTVPLSDTSPVFVENSKEEPGTQMPPKTEFNQAPKLTAAVKNGKNRVYLSWTKISGADGYLIYQYNEQTKKEKLIKTVTDPNVTTFSKKYSYALTYAFRIRAYKGAQGGGQTLGDYSELAKATLPPAKVKGLSAKYRSAKKVTLSWRKAKNADGYQIYRSTKKNGKYSRYKTMKKGSATKYTKVKQKSGKKYYYKIRAYIDSADNGRVYGSFSTLRKKPRGSRGGKFIRILCIETEKI